MRAKRTIKLITFGLLFVFGMNTILGFACSAGLDLGFNSNHHTVETNSGECNHSGKVMPVVIHAEQIHHDKSSTPEKDCCSENVLKISLSDKNFPKPTVSSDSKFFPDLSTTWLKPRPFAVISDILPFRYYTSGHHPPIADIRIAIRSFLI